MIFKQFSELPDHPCINDRSHHRIPRIHLPVAPRCNIQCGYCERKIEKNTLNKPGQCDRILTPEEAVDQARDFIQTWGRDAVVGIAGPGDPLANEETFETLERLYKDLPEARLCLCTNGLNLPNSVDLLKQCHLSFVSVTVNGVDPQLTALIHSRVADKGSVLKDAEGTALLWARQREGIKKAVSSGIFVKINSVVIPGINLDHIPNIAQKMAELGVGVMNVMPLIPGGIYSQLKAPGQETMNDLYRQCNQYLNVFTSCKQCRADARGIPGKERCTWKKTA